MTKEECILFLEYYRRFKQEERVFWGKIYEKMGGMVSWVGKSDHIIYEEFVRRKPIESQSMPGIIYTYDNGKEENNIEEYKKQAR